MLFALLIAASTVGDATAKAALSGQAEALIAPVHQAYSDVKDRQARLPPAKTNRERLERMFDMDQAGREALNHIDLSPLPEPEHKLAYAAMWSEIQAHDAADQTALKAMMPASGWFLPEVYGQKAANAAFLIVQHAVNDPDLMHDTLVRLRPPAQGDQASGQQYALLYDRVALQFDHKLQRFGTQLECREKQWRPRPTEDPPRLDERRRAIGLKQSEADYLRIFQDKPCN
jgi:hypothetical protein